MNCLKIGGPPSKSKIFDDW